MPVISFVVKQQMLKVVRGINFHKDWQATIEKQVKSKLKKLNSHYKYRNFHKNITSNDGKIWLKCNY